MVFNQVFVKERTPECYSDLFFFIYIYFKTLRVDGILHKILPSEPKNIGTLEEPGCLNDMKKRFRAIDRGLRLRGSQFFFKTKA